MCFTCLDKRHWSKNQFSNGWPWLKVQQLTYLLDWPWLEPSWQPNYHAHQPPAQKVLHRLSLPGSCKLHTGSRSTALLPQFLPLKHVADLLLPSGDGLHGLFPECLNQRLYFQKLSTVAILVNFLQQCTWQSVHQDLVNMYLLNSNVSLYILATLYLRFCLWKFVHYGLMLIKETRWTVLAIPFYLFEKQRETFDKLIPSYNVWNNMSSGPELSTSVRTFLQVGSSLSKIIEGHLGIFQGQQRLIGCWRLQSSNSWRQHLSAPWTFQVSGMWFYHGSQHALKHSSCTWSCHQRLPQHRTPHPKSLLEFLLWEARLKRFTSLKSTWSQKYAVYKVYVQV